MRCVCVLRTQGETFNKQTLAATAISYLFIKVETSVSIYGCIHTHTYTIRVHKQTNAYLPHLWKEIYSKMKPIEGKRASTIKINTSSK